MKKPTQAQCYPTLSNLYANLPTDNIFRAVSSLTPHALEKLFTDQDYLGFHAMNFPHRNPTLLEAHAPKYLVFFKSEDRHKC